jgi:amino acid transporter
MASMLKRLLVGPPIATAEESHQRLGKPTALAVFASDAISSTAYASQEILLVLVPVIGMAGIEYLTPIALVVAVLLFLVISSYRQTVKAYPGGAGSYVVSRENLGRNWSLIAGASVLVDYTLTVAVSVSAGIAAITSAFDGLLDYRVVLCLVAIAVMTLANLRGAKESGKIFAPPVYTYVVMLTLLIGYGLFEVLVNGLPPMPEDEEHLLELAETVKDGAPVWAALTPLLLLRAFSSGAVALTGVEAISDGVAAFRKPESKNAGQTLAILGLILGTAFLGLSILAHYLEPTVSHDETLLSTMGRYVFDDLAPLYYVLQFSTFAILLLAANTAFADFPRVSSLIAGDGYLPRQFANRGDRLVFSNGVIVLALVAGLLIVAFGGETTALIPLYAVGVFTGFTLSQLGMFRYARRERPDGWQRNQVISIVGAAATFLVLLVVLISKFIYGAWIPAVLIPFIVVFFLSIHRHYDRIARGLEIPLDYRPQQKRHTVVVLVGRVNRGVIDALSYAESLRPDRLMAATVVTTDAETDNIMEQWEQHSIPIQLRVLHDPYRDLTGSVLRFLDELDEEWPDDVVTVVVPEFVLNHWWEQALHNQSALMLRARLRDRPNTVIVAVPTHLHV